MSTKDKELKYSFLTEKAQLIDQCIGDLKNFGYTLTSRIEEEDMTNLVFTLKSEKELDQK